MTVSITIRNVPDHVRDSLAARAAASGRSMQEFLAAELRELATRPSQAEVLAEIRRHARGLPPVTSAEILADLHADRR